MSKAATIQTKAPVLTVVIGNSQLEIEKASHEDFKRAWRQGLYAGQRYGQAFYTHFKLHRLSDQERLRGLYEKDGTDAHSVIGRVFVFR